MRYCLFVYPRLKFKCGAAFQLLNDCARPTKLHATKCDVAHPVPTTNGITTTTITITTADITPLKGSSGGSNSSSSSKDSNSKCTLLEREQEVHISTGTVTPR